MAGKKRKLISNISLEPHFCGLRAKDFYKYLMPVGTIFLIANMVSIIGFSHYSLVLILSSIFTTGIIWLAFYETEYCYRVCDIVIQMISYHQKGDVLYEKFEKAD